MVQSSEVIIYFLTYYFLTKVNRIDFSQVGNCSVYIQEILVTLGKDQILKLVVDKIFWNNIKVFACSEISVLHILDGFTIIYTFITDATAGSNDTYSF